MSARLTVEELIETFYRVAVRWNGYELPEEDRRVWFEERRALRNLTPQGIEDWLDTPRDQLEAHIWDNMEQWNEEGERRIAAGCEADLAIERLRLLSVLSRRGRDIAIARNTPRE